MKRRWRWIGLLLGGLLLVAAVAALALYQAVRHVPHFYSQALEADPETQQQACDQMLRRAGALSNDVRSGRAWQLVLTADQINGWLAVDLPQNHPDALPPEIEAPRVAIDEQLVRVGFHVHQGRYHTVVSLVLEPYMSRPGDLAVRIRRVRAGGLPIPLGSALESVSEALTQSGFKVQWRQADGDPVAVISMGTSARNPARLETLQLKDGAIYAAGTSAGHAK